MKVIKEQSMRLLVLCCVMVFVWVGNVYCASIDSAYEEYLSGRYDEARETANRLADSKDKLYFLGLVNIKLGNYSIARDCLRRFLNKYPYASEYESALIKLGDTYFLDGDLARAKNIFLEIEQDHAGCDRAAVVYLRLAQIASKEGRWSDKAAYIKIIKSNFRNAPEMKFVTVLEEQGDYFTVQVGAFGSRENAYSLDAELKRLGYSSYVDVTYKKDYTLYKVKAGKFPNRPEARRTYNLLIKHGYSAKIYP